MRLKSDMYAITNWVTLGSVAFGVSFCLSLLASRNFPSAFLTGFLTIPATYAGSVVANQQRMKQEKRLKGSLIVQVEELEDYKAELEQFVGEALTEEQEIEASINALQAELNNLRLRVAEEYNQKKQLNWELESIQREKTQEETDLQYLRSQVITFEQQIQELTRTELAKATEIKRIEIQLKSRVTELDQIKTEVNELFNNQKTLQQEIHLYQGQRQQLLEEINRLESYFISLQGDIEQLQGQKRSLQVGLLSFEEQRKQLEEQLHNLRVSTSPINSPELLPEWVQFRQQLTDFELSVLKAIAQLSNPNSTIKKIAEKAITMPELIIDSINEKAINKIGDLIITPGSTSTPPAIIIEYSNLVNQLINSNLN